MSSDPPHDAPTHRELAETHHPEAIHRRLAAGHRRSYLKDLVYGAIDGTITTFAIVSGVAGAGLSSEVIIILGVANLAGDGFSMAAGNYLSTQAEVQQHQRLRKMEERHIDVVPEGEREEIRQIFSRLGLEAGDLEAVVGAVTSDRARWIDVMMREEHGLPGVTPRPLVSAAATFAAFMVVGLLPLLSFLVNLVHSDAIASPYAVSMALTGVGFFVVGAIKSRFVEEHWLRAGAITLLVGGTAAALAYLIGAALRGIGQ